MLKRILKLLWNNDLPKQAEVSAPVEEQESTGDESDLDVLVAPGIGESADLGEPGTGRLTREEISDRLIGAEARPITGELRDSVVMRRPPLELASEKDNDPFSDMLELESVS